MTAQELLFAMLRSVICGEAACEQVKTACSPELLTQVYNLANRHDLAHLVGQAAADWKLPESEPVKLAKQTAMQALVRSVKLEYALQRLCKTLEEGQIPFIPLKGSVLRNHYPQSWMRTSCDIDILVKPSDLEKAKDLLVSCLSYRYIATNTHDMSLASPENVHLELHFDTIESFVSEKAQQIMAGVWEDATPVEGRKFHCTLSDELFYFYHIAHMAKHVANGGCGIRPFLDLWILEKKIPHQGEKRDALLAAGGLQRFTDAARKLMEIWLCGAESDEMSARLEQFILTGGTFGNKMNQVAVQQTKSGSRAKYILSRVFLPYHHMKVQFPILEKHKWLMPACQVIRWCRVPFGDARKRTVQELDSSKRVAGEDADFAAQLLEYLGMEKE